MSLRVLNEALCIYWYLSMHLLSAMQNFMTQIISGSCIVIKLKWASQCSRKSTDLNLKISSAFDQLFPLASHSLSLTKLL